GRPWHPAHGRGRGQAALRSRPNLHEVGPARGRTEDDAAGRLEPRPEPDGPEGPRAALAPRPEVTRAAATRAPFCPTMERAPASRCRPADPGPAAGRPGRVGLRLVQLRAHH